MTRTSSRWPWLGVAVLIAALSVAVACSSDSTPSSAAVQAPPEATVEGTARAAERSPASAPGGSAGRSRAPAATQSAEPDANLAFSHIEKLAGEIGVRVAGSAEERAAAQYIADALRSYGYDVELQPFGVTAFISRSVSLRMEAPQQRSFETQALRNSRPGSASSELVYAGIGRPADFGDAARGRIALVERGELTFQQKAMNAAAAGARALIIFNTADELFNGELNPTAPDLPVLALSGADGRLLRDRLQAGPVRVSLSFEGGRETSESVNVIARPPGGRCRVLLGGHFDTVPGAPGASDNASGTAAVIEMARVQALRGNPEQACFAAFGAEETGLNGSRHFVRSLSAEERQAMRFMLNFDMVAVGTEWLLIGTPSLQEQGRAIMSGMGLDTRFIVPLGFSSDHASFMDAGIPALFLHRSDDPLLHTPQDTVGRISIDQLGEAMRIGLAFLEGMGPA